MDVRVSTNLVIDVWAVEGRRHRPHARQALHNLTVDAGLNLIRDLINGGAGGITHFAVGTDGTAAAANQTALLGEVFRATTTLRTTTLRTLTIKYYLSTLNANGHTLHEVGLFNAASAGTMYARAALASPIVKTVSLAVTFTWTLGWSPAP